MSSEFIHLQIMIKNLKQLREDFAQKLRKDQRESLFKSKRVIPFDYKQLQLNNPLLVQIHDEAFNFEINSDQVFNFDTTENQQIYLIMRLFRYIDEIEDNEELLQNCDQSTDQMIELIMSFIDLQNPKFDYMCFEILAFFTYQFSEPCQTIFYRHQKQLMQFYQSAQHDLIKTKILTIYCNIAAEDHSYAFDIFNMQIIHQLMPAQTSNNLATPYLVELGYLLNNLINSKPFLAIPVQKQLIPIQQNFLYCYAVQIASESQDHLRIFLKGLLTLFENVPASQEYQTQQFSLFLVDLIAKCKAKCITQIIMILNKFHEEIEVSYEKQAKYAILTTYMQVAKAILTETKYDEEINNTVAMKRIKYRLFSACLLSLSNEDNFMEFAIHNNFHDFLIDFKWKDFPMNYCFEQLLNFVRALNEINSDIIQEKNFKILVSISERMDEFNPTLALNLIELFKSINPAYFEYIRPLIEKLESQFDKNEEIQNEIEQTYEVFKL